MRRGGDNQTGAAAVEFALLVTLFFMIVMGTINAGLALDRNNSLTHGAREAVRFGATLPAEGTTFVQDSWFTQIAKRTVDSAAGQLGAGVQGRFICVAYIGFEPRRDATNDWTRKRVESGTTVTYTSGSVANPSSWCYDDGRGSDGKERRIQVVARRQSPFNVVVFSTTLSLETPAVARFEALP